jgi:hypothetical protein
VLGLGLWFSLAPAGFGLASAWFSLASSPASKYVCTPVSKRPIKEQKRPPLPHTCARFSTAERVPPSTRCVYAMLSHSRRKRKLRVLKQTYIYIYIRLLLLRCSAMLSHSRRKRKLRVLKQTYIYIYIRLFLRMCSHCIAL